MNGIISSVIEFISLFRLADVVDMAIVAFVFYKFRDLFREARVWQVLKAIALFIIATWISGVFQLNTINFLLRNTMQVGILALIILFQPELRRMLERIGRANFESFFKSEELDNMKIASEITKAACALSRKKLGALIVIEGDNLLTDIFGTGTKLSADVTADLLITLFFDKTPLHDGAVVIRGNKILYAACVLPLTKNESLSHELGTRHRAAIGLSEISDATVLVVSEETGKISIAENGELTRDYTEPTLLEKLEKVLLPSGSSKKETKGIQKLRGRLNAKNK